MNISFSTYTLHFKHTFRVAGAKDRDSSDIGIIRLDADGTIGFGEAAPSKFWGENLEQVKEVVGKIDLKTHTNPLVYELILKEVKEEYQPPQAFLAALDMALFDCIGKKMQIPIKRFLGISNKTIPQTSFTIGFADLDTIEKKVKEAESYPILKIKLGTSYDIEIIEKVRSITNKPILVDANEGWLKEEAVEKIKWLETQNVQFVEQPLSSKNNESMIYVKERVNLPLIADESVKNSAGIAEIKNYFDGINIKLMKCGGILEAIKMVRLAREYNLKVMVGCMSESSLGISAAANLLPMVDYADLDSHLLIKNDPFDGLKLEDGYLQVAETHGLGVFPKNNIF
jgi:L-Ala-D/L-Glu epimerase